ncbi:glycoside hydrolase [Rivularia sp. IAM M-261]|nr:glycoside hydrolase [Calothrix sp. PCC 7716]GJD17907.1 glycoside hydrolase [Rivularia sp. IAM M-261]
MNILYLCNEYPPFPHGGIGTAIKELARELAKRGHQITVVGVYPQAREEVDLHGVRVVRLPRVKTPGISWYLNRQMLKQWVKQEINTSQVDIIEGVDYGGWLSWTDTRVPSVLRLHGTTFFLSIDLPKHVAFLEKQLEMKALKSVKNWIGVSNHVLNQLLETTKTSLEHQTVIPNPVNTNIFYPTRDAQTSSSEQIILFAGTVCKRKGALSLAKAANIFLKEFPKARLVFLGKEPLHKGRSIQAAILDIVDEKLRDRVIFLGNRPHYEVADWMRKATIFTMPSHAETCGNVWLEAMACELPVIGSTKTCGPEVVEDGISGLLANPDSPEDVADKISRIFRNKDLADYLGQNAKQRVFQYFSHNKVAEKTLDFYQTICN